MGEPAKPQAGWYLDPTQLDTVRYWDGAMWTAHTRPWPPPVEVPLRSVPAVSAVDAHPPVSSATPTRPRSRRRLIALVAVAVALLALLVFLSAVGYKVSHPGATLATILYMPPIYRVATAPPAEPYDASTRVTLAEPLRGRLLALLSAGRYAELDAELGKLHAAFAADHSRESEMHDALWALAEPGEGARLDAWVGRDTQNPYALATRACYWFNAAYDARGAGTVSETSEAQFEEMARLLELAQADADAALRAQPQLPDMFVIKIWAANMLGQEHQETNIFDDARASLPDCIAPYSAIARAKRPRWGGDYQQMERIADMAVAANPSDARAFVLYGLIYEDQADGYHRNWKPEKAYDLYTTALSYGEHPSFRKGRAQVLVMMERDGEAIQDADRGLALDPQDVELLTMKTRILLRLKREPEALETFKIAEATEPGHEEVTELREWFAKNE